VDYFKFFLVLCIEEILNLKITSLMLYLKFKLKSLVKSGTYIFVEFEDFQESLIEL